MGRGGVVLGISLNAGGGGAMYNGPWPGLRDGENCKDRALRSQALCDAKLIVSLKYLTCILTKHSAISWRMSKGRMIGRYHGLRCTSGMRR